MPEANDIADDRILPEYGLKGGMRGKFAARQNPAAADGRGGAPSNARVVKSSARTGTVSRAAARAAARAVTELQRRAAESSQAGEMMAGNAAAADEPLS